jgi:hypothetical protein
MRREKIRHQKNIMTPAERKRIVELCGQLQGEQDPKKFSITLSELFGLLERKGTSVQVAQPAKPDTQSAE